MGQKLSTALFALVLLTLVTGTVDAAPNFSVKDVNGPNAFAFDGFATATPGPAATGSVQVPVAAVGRFVADNGTITDGVRTLVVGGVTFHETFTCTYTVNADGTGHAECDLNGGRGHQHESYDFVIVKKKDEVFFTSTTLGGTIRGVAKSQQKADD